MLTYRCPFLEPAACPSSKLALKCFVKPARAAQNSSKTGFKKNLNKTYTHRHPHTSQTRMFGYQGCGRFENKNSSGSVSFAQLFGPLLDDREAQLDSNELGAPRRTAAS